MKPLKPGTTAAEVLTLRALLRSQGYKAEPTGRADHYDAALAGQVFTFQAQHRNSAGAWLATDRIVGPQTWWALQNPDGKAQSKGSPLPRMIKPAEALPPGRAAIVAEAIAALRAGIKEKPSGSNWGGGVERFLTHAGNGPQPWCLHFISHIYKEATGAYPFGHDHGGVWRFWQEAKKRKAAFPIGSHYTPRPGDVGVIIYPGPKKEGHAFLCTAVERGTALGYRFNAVGGNEGNAVRFSIRTTWAQNFQGFVNLYGDADQPYTPQGLQAADDAIESVTGTR